MTHTQHLRTMLKSIGHFALCRWMMKHGYPFDYAYYVVFNKQPSKR